MKKATMKIEGMHCAACGANVTRSLSKIGAKDISVNVLFGKAFADVDNNVTEDHLRKAVKDVGFELIETEFE